MLLKRGAFDKLDLRFRSNVSSISGNSILRF